MSYHNAVLELYRDAALQPADNLCCVPSGPLHLPGLVVPDIMHEMNYGCGSTVHWGDMRAGARMLYVGVGGGLEALQLAYFSRRAGGVVAVDPVPEMRQRAAANLALAAELNDWFDTSFVSIVEGDALSLPIDNESIDFAAQNCLFNIFAADDLQRALAEMHRVLAAGGKLVMSDPITPKPLPGHLVDNERLRAECLSGCQTIENYLAAIADAGFGTIEVRSRRPYRVLDAASYSLAADIMLETIEVACIKTPVPSDGVCIFTGRTATYTGPDAAFDDGKGHTLPRNMPNAICDKTANALAALDSRQLLLTDSTWHYAGGGCC